MAVIADVFDVILIDDSDDVIGTTTLQDANIDVTVQENDVRGGKGNQLLGILHADRDIAVNLNDINFKYEWLAKQFGSDITTGAGIAYAMPKFYQVVDNSITLDEEAIDGTVKVYDADGELLTPVTVTGKEVELPIGTSGEVEVRTYQYTTPASTQEFKIDNSKFAGGVKAVLETIEVDESTETVTHKIQYEFHRALPTGAFTVNTASERTAQAQAFNLRVVKPRTSTEVGIVKRIPINE